MFTTILFLESALFKVIVISFAPENVKLSFVIEVVKPELKWTEYLSSSNVAKDKSVGSENALVSKTITPWAFDASPVICLLMNKLDVSKSTEAMFASGNGEKRPVSFVRIFGIPKNACTDRALATGVVVVCAVGNEPL